MGILNLVSGQYLLKKFPGKGGWTYAEIPEIKQDKTKPFGWVRVNGSIDDYPLKHYKLMPMGEGKLFLPVKSAIQKAIKKKAGDIVQIILSLDVSPSDLSEEIKSCLREAAPNLIEKFNMLEEREKHRWIDRIHESVTEDIKAKRIVQMIERLLQL